MLRGMMPLPTRGRSQVLLMVFDDAALVIKGRVEGDGFTVLPGHIRRLSAVLYPDVDRAMDEYGNWNYQAVCAIFAQVAFTEKE